MALEKRKRGRPKKIGKPTAYGGTRKIIRMGGSLGITFPPEFVEAHNLKEGDDLPYAANHIIKYIPMPEEHYRLEETPRKEEQKKDKK